MVLKWENDDALFTNEARILKARLLVIINQQRLEADLTTARRACLDVEKQLATAHQDLKVTEDLQRDLAGARKRALDLEAQINQQETKNLEECKRLRLRMRELAHRGPDPEEIQGDDVEAQFEAFRKTSVAPDKPVNFWTEVPCPGD